MLESYLTQIALIRGTGVPETSGYPALSELLGALGQTLKPKVHCIINPANAGAGIPDGGFFTPNQLPKGGREPLPGLLPERGALEVKPVADDLQALAASEQVRRYLDKYRQVLLTNYRQFVLMQYDSQGQVVPGEHYDLAATEADFWELCRHPQTAARLHEERFTQYLSRVMLQQARLTDPQAVAWFLASYARDAKSRLELRPDMEALAFVRTALEEALGLKFEGDKGDHFFRSTLVQTLFYGIFAAWVLWHKESPTRRDSFDWHLANWSLHVPMISALYEQIATKGKLEPLDLTEVLGWAGAALSRVDRQAFFQSFDEGHAVQYFYEPFLQAFDPELRKELGVWYTPPEIVQYMVARVDTVLREELGVADGLADENVYILDPCCGTGAYLVEVLRKIEQTRRAQSDDALVAQDVKAAALKRVFGFEIMPAPFVVSHLQLGLHLANLKAPLTGDERAGVYLTNALTGWEPPTGAKKQLALAEMQDEKDAAEHIKQTVPVLVVIGNPPYNGYAGVSPTEEEGLIEPYKQGLKEWGITKNYLDDLYVRFFRVAERRIAEVTKRGVVSFISNHSWVSDPTYVILRKHLLGNFDALWIENMHGNRKISEYAPDGKTSETVFAISGFSGGIQQGVVTSLWVKRGPTPTETRVLFRDDISDAKAAARRAHLLASLDDQDINSRYQVAHPTEANRFSFRPENIIAAYPTWPSLPELAAKEPLLGLNDNRGQATHDFDQAAIAERMRLYYDPETSPEDLHPGLTTNAASFNATSTRTRLLKESGFDEGHVWPFWFKPFDKRWAYIERVGNLWNRVRPELLDQAKESNQFLLTRRHTPRCPDGAPIHFSRYVADQHALQTDAYFIPIWLHPTTVRGQSAQVSLIDHTPETTANLSQAARHYLMTVLELAEPNSDAGVADLVWMHALSLGASPAYVTENADGIHQDWPRIPLPASRDDLLASAALGRQVAALLDTETPVPGVSSGTIRPDLCPLGTITCADGGPLNLAADLEITAGWGHRGQGGVTMPGAGDARLRDYQDGERLPSPAGRGAGGEALGERTYDLYLNDRAYWKNVPERVWTYTIGGYQVVKKWLSYRESKLLGRPLKPEDARYVQEMIRRIAALILLEPELDANYETVKADTYPWPPTP